MNEQMSISEMMDALRQLRRVQTKDFEVVEMRGMVTDKRR